MSASATHVKFYHLFCYRFYRKPSSFSLEKLEGTELAIPILNSKREGFYGRCPKKVPVPVW